jgi:putative ABC transport system permease protein
MTIVARVSGPALDRIAVIRSAVQAVDPKVPVFNVKTMDERLDTVLARPKFYTTAVVFFGALGLLLAVMGVYGVVSHAVLERTREMGVRLALGTTPIRLRATMLRQAFVTIGAGGVVGVLLVAGFRRYLQSLVHGADAALAAAAVAVAITALVAAAAVWIATYHIARLDVSDVLRAEAAE